MTAALKAKFEAFHRFLTVRFFGAQADPISEVTARKYQDHVRCVRRLPACLRGDGLGGAQPMGHARPGCMSTAWHQPPSFRPSLASGMLGWLHRERGVLLGALSFSAAVPSSGREGVSLLFDYLLWLSNVRGISVRTEGIVVRPPARTGRWGSCGLPAAADPPVFACAADSGGGSGRQVPVP